MTDRTRLSKNAPVAKRRTPSDQPAAADAREALRVMDPPSADELEHILGNVSDEALAKASMSAAIAVQGMYETGKALKNPETVEDWIALYHDHVWAYAGIYAIASTISRLEVQLYQKPKKGQLDEDGQPAGPIRIYDHPILDRLQKPNDSQTGYDLMEMLVIYLETAGEGYWEVVWGREAKVQVTTGKRIVPKTGLNIPTELYNIRPSRITPRPDKAGKGIKEYVYQLKMYAKKHEFSRDQVIPFMYANPLQDWAGQGSLEAAVDDLRGDKQMAQWNNDFFKNGATPEGIIRTDQNMTVNELKVIGAQIRQFLKGKGRNILLLTKGLEWQTISLDPKDVDFLEGRKAKREAILACLGVPPCKVGLLDSAKYDNYRLQLSAFAQDTVIPKVRKLESVFNCYLAPLYSVEKLLPPGFAGLTAIQQKTALTRAKELALVDETDNATHYLTIDVGPITREDEDKLTDRLVKQMETGLVTPDEAREVLGRKAWKGQKGGDKFYMKTTLTEVGTVPAGGETGLEGQSDIMSKRLESLEHGLTEELGLIKAELIEIIAAEVTRRVREA